MKKIDSHQHFWLYNPVKEAWITDDMAVIQRDFLPADVFELLQYNNIDGCIAVQADQSEAENEFLLDLAKTNPFIKGIVGWIDLQAENIEERLAHYQQYELVKGFRHIVQPEPEGFMLTPEFKRGISKLALHGYTYDIIIGNIQLKEAIELVAGFPEQKFVVDHLAKPNIKSGEIDGWKKDIQTIASFKNVYCKISGFCTEADWYHWKLEDIVPYLDVVFAAFGTDRVMYGSDWPVSLLAGGYNRVIQSLKTYVQQLTPHEQDLFWGGNAADFYNLDI
ncbi:amidohydrolase family protein [Mucilaginibacter sp. UR6-1]|uniref:amidohydrolase family protein n=1 Tax=Mucilaginibacter sp. UR6-1 TaxID=1435643 RepID=UPI001E3C255A|nr:amidohydrolase family protein [Mucilaginibacter sp. UR6-1]MCC8410214.1 amidohydrolase family protein [Mucilaginibacter sp. UR6-1]